MSGWSKFSRLASLAGGLALITVVLLGATARPSDPNSVELFSDNPSPLSAQQIRTRDQWYAERLGLQFGVPPHARADAIAQAAQALHPGTLETSNLSNVASLTWNNIGPLPMTEASNFGGVILGSAVAMTGRVSAIAVDPGNAANIAIGAANGGVWISTDMGAHFAPVFDAEPSQAIGALAFDTTTSPSTLWAGTGEGNNALDAYYGQGLYKSTNLGSSWAAVGGNTFDH
ncbi:MAG: WD40/YVTN/BNR-like repeat-containing protein, partial [Candidatus Binataceae bacterium]